MASLTLKNLPDDLLERLRRTARAERRSLNQQAVVLLEGGLCPDLRPERDQGARAQAAAQVAAWRELAGRWVSDEPMPRELQRLRSRRTRGRAVRL